MKTTTRTFTFDHETDCLVFGKDADGEWRFAKDTVDYEIVDGKLIVTAPNKRWTRLKYRRKVGSKLKKPGARTLRSPKAKRNCLTCNHPFKAERNIYICDPCKSTEAWRFASTCELHVA